MRFSMICTDSMKSVGILKLSPGSVITREISPNRVTIACWRSLTTKTEEMKI